MSTDTEMTTVEPKADDPFRIGWRDVHDTLPDGKTILRQEPLTLEDFLHPKAGDHFVESSLHDVIRRYLADVFMSRVAEIPRADVLSDVAIYWDDPDYGHNCPDVAVIFDVRFPKPESFDVAEQGTRPRLILELTSPSTRKVDLGKKLTTYHGVGVTFYIVIDRADSGEPWTLTGYQWTPSQYRPMLGRDEKGRIWLESVNLWIAVEGDRVLCYDDESDEPLGDYTQVSQALDRERQRADSEHDRAEAERTRADAAERRIREMEAELARLRQNP
jgi:colicin import membrane protein